MSSDSMSPPRARVYIDGFNLYYGALKRTPHKWLDLEAWCARLLPGYSVDQILYCTARVTAMPTNPGVEIRQQAYLRALATLPKVVVLEGMFKVNDTRAPRRPESHCACCQAVPPGCSCCAAVTVPIIKTEEKGSDVNLAVAMVRDGFQDRYDTAAIVSEDSDLQGAVDIVRNELAKQIIIVTPRNRKYPPLVGDARRQVRDAALAACQFAGTLSDAHGVIHRPNSW